MKSEVPIALLFSALLGVQCVPIIKLFNYELPIPTSISNGKQSIGLNLELSKDGLELSRRKESYSEKNQYDEQHNSANLENYNRNDTSSHLSQEQWNTSKLSQSHESNKKTQDTGLKLGKGGLSLFDKKKKSDLKTSSDQESGQTSSLRQDRSASSKHEEESGSRYNKTSQTKNQKDDYDNKELSIGGTGGLFKKTKEKGSSETHDASNHEEGSSWRETKDAIKDGGTVNSTATKEASNYAKDSNESTATSNHTIETNVHKQDDNQGQGINNVVSNVKDKLKSIGFLGNLFG